MSPEHIASDETTVRVHRQETSGEGEVRKDHGGSEPAGLAGLQRAVGNRAVQRLLVQRSGDGPSELDDETASRINSARGGGQPLHAGTQTQMGEALGADLSGVRVHTSPEAHDLNQRLGAKAFTTGTDVFFRQGAYQPDASSGQELIAHELTHVVQQSTGAVGGGGGKMTVNAPGDAFEQEADGVASDITRGSQATGSQQSDEIAQLQPLEEEEEVQMQELEEEEEVQMQELEEEEELGA